MTTKEAMDRLKFAMKDDPSYAWSWHCNIAMVAYDAGADSNSSNLRAANFMHNIFDVDTLTQYVNSK